MLPYRISFENDPTATAPAQRVVVTDHLDPNVDSSTFQFTEVGFGDNRIAIPAGSQHFQTTLPMTYGGLTFNVEIELSLDTVTGLVTATFQSIDPATSLPPDVLIGFLPPEDGTGRGLGYFSYTVLPKAGLPTGTQLRNVATVIFDNNPPITTDQVSDTDPSKGVDPAKQDLNTIDSVPPTSSVQPLPALTRPGFTVSWAGQDDPSGSGIGSYDLYVSDNGGAYTPFLIDTAQTSTTFAGLDHHTYRFYTIAHDNAGNTQTAPGPIQTTTVVNPADHLTISAPGQAIGSGQIAVLVNAADALGLTDSLYNGSIALNVMNAPAGGALSGVKIVPVKNGVATFSNLSFNLPGRYTLLVASTSDLLGATATITVTPTTHFAVTSVPATSKAGAGFTLTVTALDARGLKDPTYVGTVHFSSTDPQAGLPGDYTFTSGTAGDNGVHTFTVTLKTAGRRTITAADATNPAAKGVSTSVTVTPATPSALSVTGYPSIDVTGVSHRFTVTAVDAYGNKVPSYTGTVRLTSSDPQAVFAGVPVVSGFPTYTFTPADQGAHTFSATLKSLGSRALTATDTHGITGTESGINVVSSATHFSVAAPMNSATGTPLVQTAGTPFNMTVTALNALGAADTLFQDTVHFTSSDHNPLTVLPADYTFTTGSGGDNGKKTFSITLATAGSQTITVTDIVRPAIKGSSLAVPVVATSANHLSVAGFPTTAPGGVAGSFTVTALDPYGNRATNFRDAVQLASTDPKAIFAGVPTVSGIPTYLFTPRDNGAHAFSATLNTIAGGQALTATDSAHNTIRGTQSGINVVSPATHLSIAVPINPATLTPAAQTAGTPFAITVTALTALGLPDKLFIDTVHFTSSDPKAGLPSDYTFLPGDSGKKMFNITQGNAGSQTITVTDTIRPAIKGTGPAVPVNPGVATTLAVSGFPSLTLAGAVHRFTVTALDRFGNKATGYRGTVQLTSTNNQATITGAGVSVVAGIPTCKFTATDQGVHTFSASFKTPAAFPETETLTATDPSANITGTSASIKVVRLTANVAGPSVGVRGQPLSFTLNAPEDGQPVGAMFTYHIDWTGAGTVLQTISGPSGLTVSHVYPTAGNFTVKVTAADLAGNVSPQAAAQAITIKALALETDPGDNTKTALVVGGTTGTDTITITPTDAAGDTVSVSINGVTQPGGPFTPTGHILVYGQGGNDVIKEVAATINGQTVKIAIPALIFAGPGSSTGSTLSAAGSSANNILVGGTGNDSLIGGSGRDILIGGPGADTLRAGSGEDLLIGGNTSYNNNLTALMALIAEWGRTDQSYQQRVEDLYGTATGGLNGSYTLAPSTVAHDAAINQLFGGPGLDWFWFSESPTAGDRIFNFIPGEVATYD